MFRADCWLEFRLVSGNQESMLALDYVYRTLYLDIIQVDPDAYTCL